MNRVLARNSGAAPATVSSELLPNSVTDAFARREDGKKATTCEPGDLPRQSERPRAGCPGGRLHALVRHLCRRPAASSFAPRPNCNNAHHGDL